MKRYTIQKRVANTEHWGSTGREADTFVEAKAIALAVDGGKSTGVRVFDNVSSETILIVGC